MPSLTDIGINEADVKIIQNLYCTQRQLWFVAKTFSQRKLISKSGETMLRVINYALLIRGYFQDGARTSKDGIIV